MTRLPAGPLDRDPGGFIPRDEQRTMLLDVLAGVELGVWDRSIVEWLSGYDASTVVTIASLIERARQAAAAQVAADRADPRRWLQEAAGEVERERER